MKYFQGAFTMIRIIGAKQRNMLINSRALYRKKQVLYTCAPSEYGKTVTFNHRLERGIKNGRQFVRQNSTPEPKSVLVCLFCHFCNECRIPAFSPHHLTAKILGGYK